MKKLIFSSSVFIFAVAVGWYYVPETTREKAGAFIAGSFKRDSGEVTNAIIKEVLLPESPQKKQEEILTELKSNFQKVREETAKLKTKEAKDVQTATEEIIRRSEHLLEEIPKKEDSPTIAERVVDLMLPSKKQECKE